MHEKKINNLSGGEWRPTTETKPGVVNMAKGRATRDVMSDERFNEMREQRDIKRQNAINKRWSHPQVMKKIIEFRSLNNRS